MFDKTFPAIGHLELHCEFSSGTLTVRAREQLAEARVSITGRDPRTPIEQLFRVELSGNRLEVVERRERGPFVPAMLGGELRRFGRSAGRDAGLNDAGVNDAGLNDVGVNIVVELPAGSGLRIAAMSAAVTAEGRVGTAEISCGSATVDLDVVDGALRVRGGSGTLTINRLAGAGNVRSGSGTVRIGEAAAELSLGVGSGQVAIGTAHGAVRLRSGSGGAVIEIAEQDIDIASSSGPVTIGLRAGQQARLDVATGSGRLHTEMPVQDSAAASGRPITIRARTGSGDVTIRRAISIAS